MSEDPRRRIPRTDDLLKLPAVVAARARLDERVVRSLVTAAQDRARSGAIAPDAVIAQLEARLADQAVSSLTPVLNATGIVVHTNLGRAPLSSAAVAAVTRASGYVDVELDLPSGSRSSRGRATRAALLRHCPQAEDALIVNNGAAALVLATTALASGREVVISRGELIEIGAGFRLTDLIESTGARLREIGTTNRTHLRDYAAAVGPDTGCILKVHPSNYAVTGFTASVPIADLAGLKSAPAGPDDAAPSSAANPLQVPLVVDLGSGLLQPDSALPDEPDAASALAAGADLVIASGDKLLGGPQAGIILGRSDLIQRLATHPLARAVRADKLALAALEATLDGPTSPVAQGIHADPQWLRQRCQRIADRVGATVVAHDGRVGGGGAPGVPLPGWAVILPEAAARALRTGDPAVLPRVHGGACLVDLRCILEEDDDRVAVAIEAALKSLQSLP